MDKKLPKTNTMWGGRFKASSSSIMKQINSSIDVDWRLWRQDIEGSMAHCQMLVKQNTITEDEGHLILSGLKQISHEIDQGDFKFEVELEDIHMNIEARLSQIIGDIAGKLHTARSRNDQVATDFRLWIRQACDEVTKEITIFQESITNIIYIHHNSIMPGFTHLQIAQPITLAMHMQAYWQMMERDKSRFEDCKKRANECPLGACALSGTGFPIDRNQTAKNLGFNKPMESTLDSVSSRDFALEFLFSCLQCGLHLSRLAEEIILWATPQFGFIKLSDEWATGSSIMPQKKNPDAAELIRAKTGKLAGNLMQLTMVMKALPLAYNKDMQEDKASIFESFDTIIICLQAMNGMINTAEFQLEAMHNAAEKGFATATELADWLVQTHAIPFRQAHHITGQIVKLAEQKKCLLHELDLKDMQSIEPLINQDIYMCLSVENAIKRRLKNHAEN